MLSNTFFLLQYAIPFLLFFLFLSFLYKCQSPPSSNTKNLPPSPPRLPVIGNLHQLGRYAHHNLQSLSQKYGDLMLLRLGSKPTLIVSSAEAALQVMKTHDHAFCSRPHWKVMYRIHNNGKGIIAAPYGEYWKNMRSICVLEVFSNTRVHSFQGIMEEEVALMVETIRAKETSSLGSYALINMREVFVSLTNNLIHRVTLGRKHDGDGSGIGFEKLLRETSDLTGRFPIGDFVPCLAWIDRLTGLAARVDKLTKSMDDFLEGILAQHTSSERKQVDGDRDEKIESRDFISTLLQLQKNGGKVGDTPMDRDSIKGLILDMFAAGIESSSGTLEWMMSEVVRNPRVMKELQEEIREIALGKNAIVWDDLKKMVYLKAVVKESLRLHPPGPLLTPRESQEDVRVNGYDIASGTLVLINAWAIARDPRYWDEPEDFCPERFLCSSGRKSHDFRMIPFGYGRRICPGEAFAVASIELAMANLLLHFNWNPPLGVDREGMDMRECPGVTTKMMTPLLAAVTMWNVRPT